MRDGARVAPTLGGGGEACLVPVLGDLHEQSEVEISGAAAHDGRVQSRPSGQLASPTRRRQSPAHGRTTLRTRVVWRVSFATSSFDSLSRAAAIVRSAVSRISSLAGRVAGGDLRVVVLGRESCGEWRAAAGHMPNRYDHIVTYAMLRSSTVTIFFGAASLDRVSGATRRARPLRPGRRALRLGSARRRSARSTAHGRVMPTRDRDA